MASEEKDFFAVKHEWMLEAVPADGTVELSDGRKLDLFLASAEGKAQSDPKYLVLVLPGGGYRFCSYREDHIVGRFFARAGFDAITIDYPTVPIVGGNPSPLTTHLSRIYGILVPSKGC